MIDRDHTTLSLTKQCSLLAINRSSYYYRPRPESSLNLELMRLMDEHYLKHPYKGAGRMHTWLTKDKGYKVSLNRIERLYYQVMGLRSLMPGPHTSKRNLDHKVYPYLLRGLKVERPNQAWATDITYIPMKKGFMYLTAIIDLYSRYVVAWSLSNSMDAEWCAELYEKAITNYGLPEIINTDQGSQYTSHVFTKTVLDSTCKLSMDGKGRATDNAFIETLWKSVKYEKVYLEPPCDGLDLHDKLKNYFIYYNQKRRHSSINDIAPKEKYFSTRQPRHKVRAA